MSVVDNATPTAPRAEQIAQIIAQGPQPAAPPAASPAPAAPAPMGDTTTPPMGAVPGSTTDGTSFPLEYVERLRSEAAAARAENYAGLQGNDRQAVESFARAIAEGNEDFIDDFIMRVAQHRGLAVGGQTAPPSEQTPYGAPPPAQQGALTAEQVQEMIAEAQQAARQEIEEAQRQATIKARVDSEFKALGVDPNSPTAEALRALGARMSYERRTFVPPAEVFDEWKRQNAVYFGQTPASDPPPVPPTGLVNGQPSHVDPLQGLTGDARAIARLEAARLQRLANGA